MARKKKDVHVCDICGFETTNGRIMSNHKRWQHLGVTFTKDGYEKVKSAGRKPRVTKILKCDHCGEYFTLSLTEAKWAKKRGNYCSRSCANSRTHTDETKRKISDRVKESNPITYYSNVCVRCGEEFITKRKVSQYCSRKCYDNRNRTDSGTRSNNDLEIYRWDCRFRFNLADYPDEFDFELVEQYGWYSAANRGNNLNGVSRDHIVSVRYGYDNDIPPEVIAHPANCRLIRQSENASKNARCDLTIDELYDSIALWNERYSMGRHVL